jgi:isocitrate dehydrogenase
MYWAQALAQQDQDAQLKAQFAGIAERLEGNEDTINEELMAAQGNPVNLQGYYIPDPLTAEKAMRPSRTFNSIIDTI